MTTPTVGLSWPTGDCGREPTEGQTLRVTAHVTGADAPGREYRWSVATGYFATPPEFSSSHVDVVLPSPPAPCTIEVQVFDDDGLVGGATAVITPMAVAIAAFSAFPCKVRHELLVSPLPRWIGDPGPDFTKVSRQELHELAQSGRALASAAEHAITLLRQQRPIRVQDMPEHVELGVVTTRD